MPIAASDDHPEPREACWLSHGAAMRIGVLSACRSAAPSGRAPVGLRTPLREPSRAPSLICSELALFRSLDHSHIRRIERPVYRSRFSPQRCAEHAMGANNELAYRRGYPAQRFWHHVRVRDCKRREMVARHLQECESALKWDPGRSPRTALILQRNCE